MKPSRGEESFVHLPAFAAKLYDGMMQGYATQIQYKEIAQDLVSQIKSGRVLDVGTGPGYLLREIHKLNSAIKLYGLDISDSMVKQARGNLVDIPVDLQCGNIKATKYQNDYFDLVTCSGSFYLWDSPGESLEEIHRILKPGGVAYLYETYRDIDRQKFWKKMRENLQGDRFIRRVLAPRFFIKQIGMTYTKNEIVEIVEKTSFAKSYEMKEITFVNLPVWVRVKLEKRAVEIAIEEGE